MTTPSRRKPSIYPLYPKGTKILFSSSDSTISTVDRCIVYGSSLLVVGSLVWVPSLFIYVYRQWRRTRRDGRSDATMNTTKIRKHLYYGSILSAALVALLVGPALKLSPSFVEKYFGYRKWRLWKAWLKYVAFEVVTDYHAHQSGKDFLPKDKQQDPSITAVIPHGIFPLSLGLVALLEAAEPAFGRLRLVVATATKVVPFLNTILAWAGAIDASRSSVNRALSNRTRLGLSPGGIGEMFLGYPRAGAHPDEEHALLASRKGFVRMALRHNIPIVPVYCFGATKSFRRLDLPFAEFMEKLSNVWRVSLCLFYGVWGLPIPFRQRLLYVVGKPIYPPPSMEDVAPEILARSHSNDQLLFEERVNRMHQLFCDELTRIFDKYKESYGWNHKILKLS